MSHYQRSLTIFLVAAIAAGSMSYELCSGLAGEEGGDAHTLRHSHGDYEHLHHHHHGDADHSDGEGDHDGVDHAPNDLKMVWSAPRSKQIEAPPVFLLTPCVTPGITTGQAAERRGVPPPRAGPDPTRQLRQIRSIVLLV